MDDRAKRHRKVARQLETWFAKEQRPLPWRAAYEPWHVWVSEVMLQQTRMEVVLRYFDRFIKRFPTPSALARSSTDEVLAHWSGLGYYRRAHMLQRGARHVVEVLGGVIPSDVDALRAVPGIGRYTAGAIASIAFDRREPIVDGNVARVLARLEMLEAPLRSAELERQEWALAAELVAEARSPRAFNQSMMELGAAICRPAKPLCPLCPLRAVCASHAAEEEEQYPRRAQKREASPMVVPLYLVSGPNGEVLMRRESGALMTGMFHLPHGSAALLPAPSDSFTPGRLIGSFRHTITHRRIRFDLFEAEFRSGCVAESGGEYQWLHPDSLSSHPHPSYVRKALALAVDAQE